MIMTGVMAIAAVTSCHADPPKGFEEFRRGLLDNFNSFKSRILEHYNDFLAGEWHEYESLEADMRYTQPKPESMPSAVEIVAEEATDQQKEMLFSLGFSNPDFKAGLNPEDRRKTPESLEWLRNAVALYKASTPADSVKTDGNVEKVSRGDIMTCEGLVEDYDGEIFNFYGMKFALPRFDFSIRDSISQTVDYANQWTELSDADVASEVAPALANLQKVSGLSDYLLFEMMMAWLDQKFPQAMMRRRCRQPIICLPIWDSVCV